MADNHQQDPFNFIIIEELARRLQTTPGAIRSKITKGVLVRGIHWFRPSGFKMLFSWSAIVEMIRQDGKPKVYSNPNDNKLNYPKDAFDGLHDR